MCTCMNVPLYSSCSTGSTAKMVLRQMPGDEEAISGEGPQRHVSRERGGEERGGEQSRGEERRGEERRGMPEGPNALWFLLEPHVPTSYPTP